MDIFGVGVTIHLGRTGDILCPVSALLAYLALRLDTPGPLFLLQSDQLLSREFLVTAIRWTLLSCGLEDPLFNGHSFRIRTATAITSAGLPDSTIQVLAVGSHQSSHGI